MGNRTIWNLDLSPWVHTFYIGNSAWTQSLVHIPIEPALFLNGIWHMGGQHGIASLCAIDLLELYEFQSSTPALLFNSCVLNENIKLCITMECYVITQTQWLIVLYTCIFFTILLHIWLINTVYFLFLLSTGVLSQIQSATTKEYEFHSNRYQNIPGVHGSWWHQLPDRQDKGG